MVIDIIYNVIILGILLFVLTSGYRKLGDVIERFLPKVEIVCQSTANRLVTSSKSRYIILIWELSYIAIVALFVLWGVFYTSSWAGFALLLFSGISTFFPLTGRALMKQYPHLPSVVRNIKRRFRFEDYFTNRFILVLFSFFDLAFWAYVIAILIAIFFKMKWPIDVYFMGFLVLPVCLNIWIYGMSKINFKGDESEVTVRKVIIYFLLCVGIMWENYSKFLGIALGNLGSQSGIESLFLTTTTVIFAAIERLVKPIGDDYKAFNNRKDSGT